MPELGNNVRVHSLFNSGTFRLVGALPPFTEIRSITSLSAASTDEEDNAEAAYVAFSRHRARKSSSLSRTLTALGQTISLNGTPYTVIWKLEAGRNKIPATMAPTSARLFHPVQFDASRFPNKPPAIGATHAWTQPFARRALVAARRHLTV